MSFPSTFLDIKTAVAAKLRLTLADDEARIGEWVQSAYADVAVETRCLQKQGTAAMTAGVATYLLDAQILHIELLTVTQAGGSPYFPLVECQLDEILNYQATSAGGSVPPGGTA